MPATASWHSCHASHDLARRVRIFLHKQIAADESLLKVEVDADTVTIRGYVNSEYARHMAANCCRRVAGVRQVVNEVKVLANMGSQDLSIAQ
jgi:osmotically-inducible protein OsmY